MAHIDFFFYLVRRRINNISNPAIGSGNDYLLKGFLGRKGEMEVGGGRVGEKMKRFWIGRFICAGAHFAFEGIGGDTDHVKIVVSKALAPLEDNLISN